MLRREWNQLLIAIFLPALFVSGCSKITATAGSGGTISPTGTVWVWKGSSKTFTMTPATGNTIADVVVDGTSAPIGSSTTYTFANVQANHTIAAGFITDSDHYKVFNQMYNTTGTKLEGCRTCHTPHSPTPGSSLTNSYGSDVKTKRTAGYTKYQSIKLIEQLDSDGDSFDNITEINARKFPGEANDHP